MTESEIISFLKEIGGKVLKDIPLTRDEAIELKRLMDEDEKARDYLERIEDYAELKEVQREREYFKQRFEHRILQRELTQPAKVIPLNNSRRIYARWQITATIAALLVATAVGLGVFLFHRTEVDNVALTKSHDFLPATYGATLQLADGRKCQLTGEGLNLPKAQQSKKVDLVYNTLSTAQGERYKVVLPDGTIVWLNSGSTLKFFAEVFAKQKVRQVELSGEAYFEVAPNKSVPFKVLTPKGAEISVIGTHFNVTTYSDESAVTITLLQGSVRVSYKGQSMLLRPDQQAVAFPDRGILTVNKNVDAARATAWRDGYFDFHEPLLQAMREMARWYNVRLAPQGQINDTVVIRASREVPLSVMLHMLEEVGAGRFAMVDSTVVVKPY